MGLHLRDPCSAVLVLRGMERRTRGSAASMHERFPKWHSDFAPDLCDFGNVTAPRTRSISATSFCRVTGAPLGKRLAGRPEHRSYVCRLHYSPRCGDAVRSLRHSCVLTSGD